MLSENFTIGELFCIGDLNCGAPNNVVPFTPRRQKITVYLPSKFIAESNATIILQVVGDSLNQDRIENGDFIIFRTKFEISEIKNNICAVFIESRNEFFAKRISINAMRRTVTLHASNPYCADAVYSFDEVEIKGIAIAFQVKLPN